MFYLHDCFTIIVGGMVKLEDSDLCTWYSKIEVDSFGNVGDDKKYICRST